MTTHDYLNQLNRLNSRIKRKVAEAIKIRELLESVPSLKFDNDRIQNSGTKDPIGDKIARMLDIEKETCELIGKMIDFRELIISQIDNIEDDREYNVLHMKYVTGKALPKIASEMNYSISQIKRIRNRGLRSFEKKYGGMYLKQKMNRNEPIVTVVIK